MQFFFLATILLNLFISPLVVSGLENLAFEKTVTTSEFPGYQNPAALVDGKDDTLDTINDAVQSCEDNAHTVSWIQIELENNSLISEIRLLNRLGLGIVSLIKGAVITISQADTDTSEVFTEWSTKSQDNYTIPTVKDGTLVNGKFINISLSGEEAGTCLLLREIEVFGEACVAQNNCDPDNVFSYCVVGTTELGCRSCTDGFFPDENDACCANAEFCNDSSLVDCQDSVFNCGSCEGERFVQQSDTDAHQCQDLTTCQAGFYESVEPTLTSDRFCSDCNAISNTANCSVVQSCSGIDGTSDVTCESCIIGHYLDGTACPMCSACGQNEFISSQCTSSDDTECTEITTCNATEYESKSPTAASDRECAACSSCEADEYLVTECVGTTDTNCSKITNCVDGEYESAFPTATSDRVCSGCNDIPNAFNCDVVASCSGNDGASNVACSSCIDNHYLDGVACPLCGSCENDEFIDTPCSATANTICSICSTCQDDEYISSACNATDNTQCTAHTICVEEEYESTPPTDTSDRECSDCSTTCGNNEYVSAACQETENIQCSVCTTPEIAAAGNCTEVISCSGMDGRTAIRCGSCVDGYYLQDGRCLPEVPCGDNGCINGGTCEVTTGTCQCLDTNIGSTCELCTMKNDTCSVAVANMECVPGRQILKCQECMDGYHLVDDVCVSCKTEIISNEANCLLPENVVRCEGSDGLTNIQCDACVQGSFLEEGSCIERDCERGSFVNENADCEECTMIPIFCTQTAQECFNNTNVLQCGICVAGYTLSNGTCIENECDAIDPDTCLESNLTTCIKKVGVSPYYQCEVCQPDYFLNEDTGECLDTCDSFPSFCAINNPRGCINKTSVKKCSECQANYYLTEFGDCQPHDCNENYQTDGCSVHQSDNLCVKNKNLVKCVEPKTSFYVNDNGEALQCANSTDCFVSGVACTSSNTLQCITCIEGFQSVNGVCVTQKGGALSTGVIVGIVIGILLAFLIVIVVAVFIIRRRTKELEKEKEGNLEGLSPMDFVMQDAKNFNLELQTDEEYSASQAEGLSLGPGTVYNKSSQKSSLTPEYETAQVQSPDYDSVYEQRNAKKLGSDEMAGPSVDNDYCVPDKDADRCVPDKEGDYSYPQTMPRATSPSVLNDTEEYYVISEAPVVEPILNDTEEYYMSDIQAPTDNDVLSSSSEAKLLQMS